MAEQGLFVVTVRFRPHAEHAGQFREAMRENALRSIELERGCRAFEVCADDDGREIFLYELYDDRGAFDAHLASPHFRAFDEQTRPWVAEKHVATYATIVSGIGRP